MMKPLCDYVGLIRQAEKMECDFDIHVYDEAMKILNNNKSMRVMELMTDLEKVIDLSIIELSEKGTIEEEALLIGSLHSLDRLIEKRELLRNALYKNVKEELTPEQKLSNEAEDLKEKYKKHFNFQ